MTSRPYPRCVCPDARATVPAGSITCQRCKRSLFPGDDEIAAYYARLTMLDTVANWLLTKRQRLDNIKSMT